MNRNDPTGLSVEVYTGDGSEWNRFALEHPECRFCHLWDYGRVLVDTYGFNPLGLVLKTECTTIGIVPLVFTNSILFGRRFVSQPFSEYGGILTQNIKNDHFKAFLSYLIDFGRAHGVKLFEFHGNLGIPENIREELFIKANPYGSAVMNLNEDIDYVFKRIIDYQARKAINKSERNGVRASEDSTVETIRNTFWPLYIRSMKRLGVPPHPLKYFMKLKEHYDKYLKIFWASIDGKKISGLMGFAIGKRIQITNIVSDDDYWDLRPNDLVHWSFIKWGCENGYKEFDFGSVRYEGQQQFKKKWGVEIRNTGYFYINSDVDKTIKTFSSSSKTMIKFSEFWKRFVPLEMTPLFGSSIRRHLVR